LRGPLLVICLLVLSFPSGSLTEGALPDATCAECDGSQGTQVPVDPLAGRLATVPLGFLANEGQLDDAAVRFYLPGASSTMSLLEGEVRLSLLDDDAMPQGPDVRSSLVMGDDVMGDDALGEGLTGPPSSAIEGCNLVYTFEGARAVAPRGIGELPGAYSFIQGGDPSGWSSGVRAYASVEYAGLYDGIDLIYNACERGPKYEFRVQPGADADRIAVRIEGGGGLRLDRDGALVVGTPLGDVRDEGLCSYYQDDPGERVECAFSLLGADRFGFRLGPHDPARALTIDPVIYSSFICGVQAAGVYEVASDADMDAYLAGAAYTPLANATPGAFQGAIAGWLDGFVTKLDGESGEVIYSTFLGGASDEWIYDIAVDGQGCAIVTGITTSTVSFPITEGAYQNTSGGTGEAFVTKLDQNGTSLVFSTFLGGLSRDEGAGVANGPDGSILVAGWTSSSDFPTTEGSLSTVLWGSRDGFLCRLSGDGSRLLYSTVVGGESSDVITGLAVGAQGQAIVVGTTTSQQFPTTTGAFQASLSNSSTDGFVLRMSGDGTAPVFSTYLGGASYDEIDGIAVDRAGDVYVAGYTESPDFPTTAGSLNGTFSGGYDGFVSKLSGEGKGLLFSTFLGHNGSEQCLDIGVNASGATYITGWTGSWSFPTTPDAFGRKWAKDEDAFFCVLDEDGSDLLYSTTLGGTGADRGASLAVTHSDVVYLVGSTASTLFPTTPNATRTKFHFPSDGFIVKFNFDRQPPMADAGEDMVVQVGTTALLDASSSTDNVGISDWRWSVVSGNESVELVGPLANFTFRAVGVYNVTLRATDRMGNVATDQLVVLVPSAGPDIEARAGSQVMLVGDGHDAEGGPFAWTWTIEQMEGDVVLHGPTPNHTFQVPGLYRVDVAVTDAGGRSAGGSALVRVLNDAGSLADAGPDLVIDQGQEAILNGSRISMGIANWKWIVKDRGITTVLEGPVVGHVFPEAGRYTVQLVVEDILHSLFTDDVTVTVEDTTPPEARAPPDVTIDQHGTVLMDVSASTDNVGIANSTFVFMYADRRVVLDGPKASFEFDIAGRYMVFLYVSDAAMLSDSTSFNVTVRDITPPVASMTAYVEVPQHSLVDFDGGGCHDDLGIVNWTWAFVYGGAVVELHGPYPFFLFDEVGTYLVVLTVMDAAGQRAKSFGTVRVLDVISPEAEAGEDQVVARGDWVTLDGRSSSDNVGLRRWTWTIALGSGSVTLEGEIQAHRFDASGEYVVTLDVEDAAGNRGSDTVSITVHDPPPVAEGGHGPPLAIAAIACVVAAVLVASLSVLRVLRRRRARKGG